MVKIWNRPQSKATNGVSSPGYTPEETTARNECAAELSAVLAKHIDKIGAYETPNNAGDNMLLALTLSIPPVEYTNSAGSRTGTRPFVLNINAPVSLESAEAQAEGDDGEEAVQLTRDELLAQINEAKAKKKAAK